jgi:hypothetical protein
MGSPNGLVPYLDFSKIKPLDLMLDPRNYDSGRELHNTTPIITTPLARTRYPTPRYGNDTVMNGLSYRATTDLGTFLRFERNTPDEIRGMRTNPTFVEWLMGFPDGWTRTT